MELQDLRLDPTFVPDGGGALVITVADSDDLGKRQFVSQRLTDIALEAMTELMHTDPRFPGVPVFYSCAPEQAGVVRFKVLRNTSARVLMELLAPVESAIRAAAQAEPSS